MIRGGGLFLTLLNENSCQIYVVFNEKMRIMKYTKDLCKINLCSLFA